MKVKSESEVTQSCLTLRDPMDCSLPGSSVHGIFQARGLEWGAIAFSVISYYSYIKHYHWEKVGEKYMEIAHTFFFWQISKVFMYIRYLKFSYIFLNVYQNSQLWLQVANNPNVGEKRGGEVRSGWVRQKVPGE